MNNSVINYMASLSPEHRKLLTIPEGRRLLCKRDFRLFCLLYFRDSMRSADTGNEVTFSEFHDDFINDSIRNMSPTGPAESRTAWICPRGSGKSSQLMFQIIWIAAFYDKPFISLFSATSTQSEDMLSNIRGQFNQNEMLRADFPDLVKPATKKSEAIKLSDNKQLIMQSNGAIITGRGVTTSVLGMRIDGRRPSHIYLDDVEAGESQTTSTDVSKLLVTITDDIMPLSLNAHFVWVGTTTRPGGLTEVLVHKALNMPHAEWADSENFVVHYHPALVRNDEGIPRSIWPERWTVEYLLSQEHTRSFKKNFLCLPAPDDFHYWTPETFRIEEAPPLDYVMLSVDPAVTATDKSDATGLAVVGYSVALRRTYVLHCEGVRLSGPALRDRAAAILAMYPEISLIFAECNQGGDLVLDIFKPLPVKVKAIRQSVAKTVRASTALAEYEKGNVYHVRHFPELEREMVAFPQKGFHDDLVDAVGSACIYFAAGEKKRSQVSGARASAGSYL